MNEREVGAAVAATAAVLSPKAREAARTGAVYGLAGVLKAGDILVGAARGAARGVQDGLSGDGTGTAQGAPAPAPAAAQGETPPTPRRGQGAGRRPRTAGT